MEETLADENEASASSPQGESPAASPPMRGDVYGKHLVYERGDYLNRRYKIRSLIGKGKFGQVLECWDRGVRKPVVIKVVRSDVPQAAQNEIKVLNLFAKNDKEGSRFVKILTLFYYWNHICIVCERLGPSLYDYLTGNTYATFPVELVREIGHQLFESVLRAWVILSSFDFIRLNFMSYLADLGFSFYRNVAGLTFIFLTCFPYTIGMHDLRLVHTDLKPANILLVSDDSVEAPKSMVNLLNAYRGNLTKNTQIEVKNWWPMTSAIKVIDFGSTANAKHRRDVVVTTRYYRAPEIVLGLGWGYPCDLWGIGCILAELCTGIKLFPSLDDDLRHLALMEKVLGRILEHMIRKAKECKSSASKHFTEGTAPRLIFPGLVRWHPSLKDIVLSKVDSDPGNALVDLLSGLLKDEPSE